MIFIFNNLAILEFMKNGENTNTCKNRILAIAGPFSIELCERCRNAAIHLGPITVRVDLSALETIHTMLGDALDELESLKQPTSFPVRPNQSIN